MDGWMDPPLFVLVAILMFCAVAKTVTLKTIPRFSIKDSRAANYSYTDLMMTSSIPTNSCVERRNGSHFLCGLEAIRKSLCG